MVVLLTKLGIAEGCAAREMVIVSEGSRGESRERSYVRSRGDETRDHVTESRVQDNGTLVLYGLKF